MTDRIDRAELIADLRERLSVSVSQMWDHMQHGCDLGMGLQGMAYAYADLLFGLDVGPDPRVASVADIVAAHGIPAPWDEQSRAQVTITADVAAQMVEAFTEDLAALDGVDDDGTAIFRSPPF